MKHRQSGQTQTISAAKAGISERSGRRLEKGLSEPCSRKLRDYRTRKDPFEAVWESE